MRYILFFLPTTIMNYQTLKTMIEGLIKSYHCPSCNSPHIAEQNVDIIGAAGNTINIDMQCPKCKKHYMARMELVGMNLADQEKFSKGSIQNMKLDLESLKSAFQKVSEFKKSAHQIDSSISTSANTIKDKEIVDLSKSLKNTTFSVGDLFSDLS
jgi:hypothetical protein